MVFADPAHGLPDARPFRLHPPSDPQPTLQTAADAALVLEQPTHEWPAQVQRLTLPIHSDPRVGLECLPEHGFGLKVDQHQEGLRWIPAIG